MIFDHFDTNKSSENFKRGCISSQEKLTTVLHQKKNQKNLKLERIAFQAFTMYSCTDTNELNPEVYGPIMT
jgi:hypothetical protein